MMTEEKLFELVTQLWSTVSLAVLQIEFLVQIVAVILGYGLARIIRPKIDATLPALLAKISVGVVRRVVSALFSVSLPIIWLSIQFIVLAVIREAGHPSYILSSTCSLLSAWVIIHIFTRLMQNTVWARLVAFCVWTITALNIVGFLAPTLAFLDTLAFTFGDTDISMLKVVKGIVASIIVFWVSVGLSKFAEAQVYKSEALTPSVQVLLAKLIRVGLIALAIMVVLSNSGINVTAFAVFGGALGVGIGFGLQKIVSNLISGIILLMDKSIKPGDVIEVGETYGRVHSMGARYASVITRDSMEFLIPNEDLITQQVVNWSYSSKNIRLKAPISVAYGSDIPKVIDLVELATEKVARVLQDPAPRCLMKGFGESSIDLELRFWIADPEKGCGSVMSDVLLGIWQNFRDNKVDVPFPQREIRVEMVSKNKELKSE